MAKKSKSKPNLLKYPKKPKAGASNTVMENYLDRVKEIEKENKKRTTAFNSEKKKREALKKAVAGVKSK